MTRWFTPAEVLRMATSANAELFALSGERNPYPGSLGVVEEGALADLLLVDGNPLTDLSLVATPETLFVRDHEGRSDLQGTACQLSRPRNGRFGPPARTHFGRGGERPHTAEHRGCAEAAATPAGRCSPGIRCPTRCNRCPR